MVLADPHQNQKLFREFLVCSGHYSGKNISSHRFARYCLKTEPRSIHETKELQKGKLTKNRNHKGKFQKSKKYIQDLNSEDHAHLLLWRTLLFKFRRTSENFRFSRSPPESAVWVQIHVFAGQQQRLVRKCQVSGVSLETDSLGCLLFIWAFPGFKIQTDGNGCFAERINAVDSSLAQAFIGIYLLHGECLSVTLDR